MKKILYYTFLFCIGFLFSCSSPSIRSATSSIGDAYTFEKKQTTQVEISYLEFLPADYKSKKEWPLLIFLHGSGERGDDLDKVAVHGPPKLAAKGQLQDFIVIAPQCPKDDYWDSLTQQNNLIQLIEELEEKLNIDSNRIYLTGLSMGGFGTWKLGATLHNKIAAIAPVCGGGTLWDSRLLVDMPIWAFHGAKDDVVPLKFTIEMVEEINRRGGEAKMTIYPDANHNSWDQAYSTAELYTWLLEQHK